MRKNSIGRIQPLLFLPVVLLLVIQPGFAQQDKGEALKQSLADNQKKLAHYQWVETTVISLKGDEKSRVQKQCFYGPDGKVQKQEISATQAQMPGGLRGKMAAKKKGQITDYMQQAVALVKEYVPPQSAVIGNALLSGNVSFTPLAVGTARVTIANYLKQGDSLTLTISTANNSIQQVSVRTYLDDPKDAISLDAGFASLQDGTSYPAKIVLNAPAKNIQVVVQNSDYVPVH